MKSKGENFRNTASSENDKLESYADLVEFPLLIGIKIAKNPWSQITCASVILHQIDATPISLSAFAIKSSITVNQWNK